MLPSPKRHYLITSLVVAAFVLRAMVPAGYMAGPLAQGQLIQLCPSGLLASEVAALFAPVASGQLDPHAHHRGHGAHDASRSSTTPAQAPAVDTGYCELGAGLVVLFAAWPSSHDNVEGADAPLNGAGACAAISRRVAPYRSRAPPISV